MLSTVIPVYNEVESLEELHAQISDVAQRNNYDLEFVFVDDGSNDGSWAKIESLASKDSRVRGIRFRRNFGKAAALSAGFQAARGEIVMTLDADLQDDPEEIPRFLAELENDLDVISGWKKVRHDPWHKVLPSRVFNGMISTLTGVRLHDHNCGFKAYRREIFDEVRLYGELHRFVPVLAAARGWRVGEIVVNHRPRVHGYSKYGVRRFVKGFLDLLTVYFLTGFGQRPQHLLGSLGILCFLIGGGILSILTAGWVGTRLLLSEENYLHLHERALFFYSIMSILLGAQFMSIGFIAELITAYQMRDTNHYSVAERLRVEETLESGTSASPESATRSTSTSQASEQGSETASHSEQVASTSQEDGAIENDQPDPAANVASPE